MSIVFVLPVLRPKSATSYLVVSLLTYSHVVHCFFCLFSPYLFAAASTSPAPGRRPTRAAPICTLSALSSSSTTAAAAVTSAKGAVGGQLYSYTVTTPVISRGSVGTDEVRVHPPIPTVPRSWPMPMKRQTPLHYVNSRSCRPAQTTSSTN